MKNTPSLFNRFSIHGTDINLLYWHWILNTRRFYEEGNLLNEWWVLCWASPLNWEWSPLLFFVWIVELYGFVLCKFIWLNEKKTRLAVHEVKLWPLDGFLLLVENGTNWGPGCDDLELGLKCLGLQSISGTWTDGWGWIVAFNAMEWNG